MAITYPLAFPLTRAEVSVTLGGTSSVAVTASPFTLDEQVQVHPGQAWRAQVAMRPLQEDDARRMIAFLMSLNGRQGTFLMGDPMRVSPRGIGTGTPLVKGAGQTGQSLVTDGWTISQTGILKAGDYIQLGNGATATLHLVLADADSNFSGEATLDLWPRIRTAPSDNAAVTVSNTVGRWRLASNQVTWSVRMAQMYGIEFDCAEDLA